MLYYTVKCSYSLGFLFIYCRPAALILGADEPNIEKGAYECHCCLCSYVRRAAPARFKMRVVDVLH